VSGANNEALIVAAAYEFVKAMNEPWLAADIGPKMACSEIEPMLRLMAVIDDDVRRLWLDGHATGDDDQGDRHHDLYIKYVDQGESLPIES